MSINYGITYVKYIIILIGIISLTSCRDLQNSPDKPADQKELTQPQKKLKSKLKSTATLLKSVVTRPNVMKEIEFAVRHNTDRMDRDERVSFKELFNENAPYKRALAKNKTISGVTNSFAESFRQAANALNKQKTLFKSTSDLIEFLKQNDIVIYWPYSEYFHDDLQTPTLTYDPIDNEDVNEGFEPVLDASSHEKTTFETDTWKTVTVNDQYAQENPTMIIKPNYIDPCTNCGGGGGGSNDGSTDNTYQLKVKEDQNATAQVHLGYIQLNEQLDGLFRGGSDLRFIFIDYVKMASDQVEAKRIYLKRDLTRPDVSNHRWKELNYMADYRWHSYQKTLMYHVYEHDGGGSTAVTINSDIELEDGTTVTVKSKYEVAKKRDPVGKIFFDRELFLQDNTNSGVNGTKDGYQIYKMNNFKSTLPHRIITLN